MIAVLGVDPGVRGGLAALDPQGKLIQVWPLKPDMTRERVVSICKFAAGILKSYGSRLCFFEKVQHMTGDGAKGSHTFGYIKGLLQGSLISEGLVLTDVYPMTWQGRLGCLTGGNKNITKLKAQRMFPDISVTHATADALLIAHYGWLCSRV